MLKSYLFITRIHFIATKKKYLVLIGWKEYNIN